MTSAPVTRTSALRTRAYELLSEELARLKALSFNELANRTSSRFIALLYNRGPWYVAADAPQSAPHVLALTAQAQTLPPYNVTGALKLPAGELEDFDVQTAIRVENTSRAGYDWRVGIFFRARDLENYYRAVLHGNRLRIEKVVQGGDRVILASTMVNTELERWYTLRVRAIGNQISVWLNGALAGDITDTTFSRGFAGFISLDGGVMSIDDVALTGGQSSAWNFDTDAQGTLPDSWRDFGVYELPNGIDYLTVSDYAGSQAIKQVTARVDWRENNATSSAQLETLVTQ